MLRDYQESAIAELFDHLSNNPCLVAPTGSGKTVMAVEFIRRFARRTLWLVHRRELVQQAAEHLEAVGLTPGIIMAGVDPEPDRIVQVASKDTLARRQMPPDTQLIVIDEAHHAAAKTYRKIIETGCPVVGLTATPFRLDGKPLGDIFGRLVIARRVTELVAEGWLILPQVYVGRAPDLSKIKKTGGDYNEAALAARLNTVELRGQIVKNWLRIANKDPLFPRKTIVFCVDVAHAKAVADDFSAAGIRSAHISGVMNRDERYRILADMKNGQLTVLTNCMILTEGWDMPHLSCMVAARPTLSLALHLQMCGRIMRPCEGKTDAIILDHAGNVMNLGPVDQHIDFSLTTKVAAKPIIKGREAKVFICPSCGGIIKKGENPCSLCGFERYKSVHSDDTDLVPLSGTRKARREVPFFDRLFQWTKLKSLYGIGHAKRQYKEQYGEWPVIVDDRLVDPDNASDDSKKAVYFQFRKMADERGKPHGMAYGMYVRTFNQKPPWSWKMEYEHQRSNRTVADIEEGEEWPMVRKVSGSR